MVDTGTVYSEVIITESRRADRFRDEIEELWICSHGFPRKISEDDEFNRAPFRKALEARGIEFKPRPSRRHNKCGIVERNNGTIKRILERLVNAGIDRKPALLIAKACVLSNCLYGTKVLRAFEIARGYATSIVGNLSENIPADILDAHKQQAEVRALNKLLSSRITSTFSGNDIRTGDAVAYYYNSSKGSEPAEWREGRIAKICEHMVYVQTGKRGPNSRLSYENLRLMPSSEIARDLMNGELTGSNLVGRDAEGECNQAAPSDPN